MTTAGLFHEVAQGIYFMPEHMWLRWMDERPGQFYASLPEETQDKLRRLTSADLNSLRLDLVVPMAQWCDHQCGRARDHRRRHPK
jgi:hypothetical protein